MKIFLITADEPFYIPVFLGEFLEQYKGEVVGTALLPPHPKEMSFRRYVYNHYEMYGFTAFLRMGFRYLKRRYIHRMLRFLGFNKPPLVKDILNEYECPIYRPGNVNSNDFLKHLSAHDIDLIASVAASQIFKKRILSFPRLGCINIHGSLLPKHRGINPSFWVLLEGESETGITVHYIDEKIDTGRIVLQRPVSVADGETLDSLSFKIAKKAACVLIEALSIIEQGGNREVSFEQEGPGSYHSFPTKENGKQFRNKGLRLI